MKATKPRQLIFTDYIPVPTEKDGYCFIFLAYDKYADFIFQMGITSEISDKIYIEKLNVLLNHVEFKKHTNDFKLITAYGEHMLKEIQELIEPHKGSLIFDEALVDKTLEPVIREMFGFIDKQKIPGR